MPKHFTFIIVFSLVLLVIMACSNNQSAKQSTELTVSAAASLKEAMDVIRHEYQEEHPEVTLKLNFGGSGTLQQQVSQGAPVDIFFSAAEDTFDRLVEDGMIAEEDGVDLLGNSIVLIVPKDEGVPKDERSTIRNFEDLAKEDIGKIAIGIPETVPAGKYSKESLEEIEVWKKVESKVVYAKDVRQVLSYVETGNVAAGMVYKTDASVSDKVTIVAEADPNTYTTIIYPVGIMKDSEHYEAAKEFYTFLLNDRALKVFKDYGFTIQ